MLIDSMTNDSVILECNEILNTIPTTRYQGSKRKILPWLFECIKSYEFNTVLDAFGGSGMVSYLFKRMGKRVTYNDLFLFNQLIGESIVENNRTLLTNNDVGFVLTSNGNGSTFITDNFHGIYYLDDENQWLDRVIGNIIALDKFYKGRNLRHKKAIAYNALFQSSLAKRPYNLFHRRNLEMRTRIVERSFGNKTTWDKPFAEHFRGFVKEINGAVFYSPKACRAICQDVFDIKTGHYDLVYLDPPYLKNRGEGNESSDYLRCYHFLEGIARYDEWARIIERETLNRRIAATFAPNYFKASEALEVFERLIKKFRGSIIVLSYRYGGTPTIDELSEIMLRYKGHLDVYDRHYKYALNKQNGDAALNREYLLIGY